VSIQQSSQLKLSRRCCGSVSQVLQNSMVFTSAQKLSQYQWWVVLLLLG